MVHAARALSKSQVNVFRDNYRRAQEKPQTCNTGTLFVELNLGCSNGCPFCSLKSEKGAKRPMPPELLDVIRKEYVPPARGRRLVAPYFASDPLDYSFGRRDIRNVAKSMADRIYLTGTWVYITTAVPKGKEALFFKLIEDLPEGTQVRLSFSFVNERRLLARPEFAEVMRKTGMERKELVAAFRASTKTKQVSPGLLNGEIRVRVLGSERLVDIQEQGSAEGRKDLLLVDNQLVFSRLVMDGKLKEGQEFRMRYWSPQLAYVSRSFWIEMRNWNIHPEGRAFSEESNRRREPGMHEYLLVRSDGSIYFLKQVRPSAEHPTGDAFTQLYGAVY